jgi:predicted small lipoprotein YifL
MRVLFFLIALAVALAACGHKGPLTLDPPKKGAQKSAPAAIVPDERERPGEAVK